MLSGGFGRNGLLLSCPCGCHLISASRSLRCCSCVLPGGTRISRCSSACISCSLRLVGLSDSHSFNVLPSSLRKVSGSNFHLNASGPKTSPRLSSTCRVKLSRQKCRQPHLRQLR